MDVTLERKKADSLNIALDLSERIRIKAMEDPKSHALVFHTESGGQESVTWEVFDREVNALAIAMVRSGMNPGDRVAVLADNSIDYIQVFWAALRANMCVVPLPAMASEESLVGMLIDSNARMLFISEAYGEMIKPRLCEVKNIASNFVITIGSDDSSELHNFVFDLVGNGVETFSWPAAATKPDPAGQCAVLVYSSGTTGLPKGILISRAQKSAEIEEAEYVFGDSAKSLLAIPLFSSAAMYLMLVSLGTGACLHIMSRFSVPGFLRICSDEHISHTLLVPIQYSRIVSDPSLSEHDLSSFAVKMSTGAPMSEQQKQDVLAFWPAGGLTEIYGMSEGGVACVLEAHKYPFKLDTVGKPIPGCEIKIVNEQGNEVAPGETGEIVGRSNKMMLGYHNRIHATQAASWYDREGRRYHRSGDLGWFDDEGFLRLSDRKKDMIISGGVNIYSIDLENVIRQHPDVDDVAVIAVASPQWGETPKAYLVLRDALAEEDISQKVDSILQWSNRRLGKSQKVILAECINSLPRNPAGKILKRQLKDLNS